MTTFDQCVHGKHDQCVQSFEKFIIDPKTNKVIYINETVECECPKRGCKCYVKAADRSKSKTRRKK